MTIHVGDIGTVVRQAVTDIADLSPYTITLRVRRPDTTTTTVAASDDGTECVAIVPDGTWTAEGPYRVQFVLIGASTSFAMPASTLTVVARV